MSTRRAAGAAASRRARLLRRAQERGEDFSLVLNRYATERFLYRLSTLPARDTYWLKGALLFDLWFDLPHRPTRDADFLGFGPPDEATLMTAMREVCAADGAGDDLAFDADSIAVEAIREDARYGGLRVRLEATLANARCSVQLDVGFGDAVTPGPEEAELPTLMDDLPPPRLRVYPRATVVAEKLEAIASLGMANTRLKDYYDLRALAREAAGAGAGDGALDATLLARAIAATFARRGTPLPPDMPLGLNEAFGRDATKRAQWQAFLGRNRLDGPALDEVVAEVRVFLAEPLRLARLEPAPR